MSAYKTVCADVEVSLDEWQEKEIIDYMEDIGYTLVKSPEDDAWLTRLAQWTKGNTLQGKPVTITAAPETRSTDQNALLHALLTDIAGRREWAGKKRDMEAWKRLFVAAWLRAHGRGVEVLPALDGHGVDIVYERTSKLTKDECGRLMEWIEAFASERGVVFQGGE
jgi:hypothetical protein